MDSQHDVSKGEHLNDLGLLQSGAPYPERVDDRLSLSPDMVEVDPQLLQQWWLVGIIFVVIVALEVTRVGLAIHRVRVCVPPRHADRRVLIGLKR